MLLYRGVITTLAKYCISLFVLQNWLKVTMIELLKYIHTEKDINSYNEVHTYSIVITLHACGLWNMPPYRSSVGSYSCISGCEYFEV